MLLPEDLDLGSMKWLCQGHLQHFRILFHCEYAGLTTSAAAKNLMQLEGVYDYTQLKKKKKKQPMSITQQCLYRDSPALLVYERVRSNRTLKLTVLQNLLQGLAQSHVPITAGHTLPCVELQTWILSTGQLCP